MFTFIAKWNVWMVYCFIHGTTIKTSHNSIFPNCDHFGPFAQQMNFAAEMWEFVPNNEQLLHEICTGVLYIGIQHNR